MKEGRRIASQINSNRKEKDQNSNILVAKAELKTPTEVFECAKIIAESYNDVAVMILSTTENRSMIVAAIVPGTFISKLTPNFETTDNAISGWIEESYSGVIVPGVKIFPLSQKNVLPLVSMVEICYTDVSNEHDPEKLVDRVLTNSFSYLRRVGLYIDPPEEQELTFDDLTDFF